MLARDRITIPDLGVPLRIFAEGLRRGRDIIAIAEEIRRGNGSLLPDAHRVARGLRLSDATLAELASSIDSQPNRGEKDPPFLLPRRLIARLVQEIEHAGRAENALASVLTVPHRELRPYLAGVTEIYFPHLTVHVEPMPAEPK